MGLVPLQVALDRLAHGERPPRLFRVPLVAEGVPVERPLERLAEAQDLVPVSQPGVVRRSECLHPVDGVAEMLPDVPGAVPALRPPIAYGAVLRHPRPALPAVGGKVPSFGLGREVEHGSAIVVKFWSNPAAEPRIHRWTSIVQVTGIKGFAVDVPGRKWTFPKRSHAGNTGSNPVRATTPFPTENKGLAAGGEMPSTG